MLRVHADEGRGVEIAGRGLPRPALPALAARLPLGAKPETFCRPGTRERGDIVVGGARLWDGPDQKSDPAAQRVARSSGPRKIIPTETARAEAMSRMEPTGSFVAA